jgi:hypothetical protein
MDFGYIGRSGAARQHGRTDGASNDGIQVKTAQFAYMPAKQGVWLYEVRHQEVVRTQPIA